MSLAFTLLTALLLAPVGALNAQEAARWVLPEVDAPRVQRVLFDSKAAGRQTSCHVFTPQVYKTGTEQRFPVLYWLHGTGGGLPGIPRLSEFFDRAMQEGKIPPMLVVFPNGLAESMWCDSKDGAAPIETIFIKELIPHIDATYRTIAAREGRILEGFSMGGYGAARLGFKHPQLFGAVSILAGGPLDLDFAGPRATGNPAERERILNSTFGGDLDYYRLQNPISIVQKQADGVRGKVRVRMAVGARDNTGPLNRAYSEHLKKLNIAHTFTIVPGVGHETLALLKGLGEANWEFYRELPGTGPTAALAQAKPEVANATKAAKRAWESAPAEKKALWQQQREALKYVDLSEDTSRQIIIARGTPEGYNAHPTTAMLADNKTMFCVWNIGHGGHAGPMARSEDGGLTWKRVDDSLPLNYVNFKNCPSIYRITDPQGKERLWVLAARTATDREVIRDMPGRLQGYMPRIMSEDDGKTWCEEPPIGGRIAKDDPFRCMMTFSSIVRLKDGSSLGLFHRGSGIGEEGTMQVLQSITRDGGFSWSPPVVVCDGTKLEGKDPCEPYVFRSPAGDELCCLMRENRRSGTSLMMFSRDEGKTWSKAMDTPWGLTGDRQHGILLPDGRLGIVFRNASPNAKDKGGFIAWVGTYDDIKQGKPGQYRVSLLKTFKDGFYPGIHLLPDGTIIATTYTTYRKEDVGCSIVSVRFKISEVDALAAKPTPGTKP